MHLLDEGSARKVAIDDEFEDIVMQIGALEVPVIVVGFVQEIEPVEPLHPTHLHLDVQVLPVHGRVVHGVLQLVHADGIAFRHHGPVVRLPIDARDLPGGELEHFEFDAGAFDRKGLNGEECEQQEDFHAFTLS